MLKDLMWVSNRLEDNHKVENKLYLESFGLITNQPLRPAADTHNGTMSSHRTDG